ncbi:Transmembrane inner ear expressed protein [Orchesella cincta]|uniref:Transmembrane inner ear expressed protein n=1 Tax=Orchesella cincta TaxID=48709 RepID=A0A1D2NLD1_ORCCI|nr:Transmembrane inner ear expressed protein [Orchesella cincta]
MRSEDVDLSERKGCGIEDSFTTNEEEQDEWMEETVWYGLRMWHVIFLSIGTVLSFVILLCCCFKFRIPRTKQEIEGDYVRRRIMRKFRKRLKTIQNQELDEMDLKKALDKIRTELKSDTESLQQSDGLSGATLSSAGIGAGQGSTYRRASQIQIDISLEDLRIQSMGLGARIALALSRLFRRGRNPQGQDAAMEEGNANNTAEGADKPTTALLSAQGEPTQQGAEDESSKSKPKKKKDKDKPKTEASSSSTPASKENTNSNKDKEKTKKSQLTTEKETKGKDKNKQTDTVKWKTDKDKVKDSKTDKSSTTSGTTAKGKTGTGGDTSSSKKSDKSKKQS